MGTGYVNVVEVANLILAVKTTFSDTVLDIEKLFHLTIILKKNKIISFNVNKIFFILTVDPVLKVLGNVCIPISPTL